MDNTSDTNFGLSTDRLSHGSAAQTFQPLQGSQPLMGGPAFHTVTQPPSQPSLMPTAVQLQPPAHGDFGTGRHSTASASTGLPPLSSLIR